MDRKWTPVILALLYAIVVLPLIYRDALGEPDLEEMTIAVMYPTVTGTEVPDGYSYGHSFSFGWYWVMQQLPESVLRSSAAVIHIINWTGAISALLAVVFLYLYFERVFGHSIAWIAAALFAFSPLFLDLGTFGHPIMPGLALFAIGAWLTALMDRSRWFALPATLVLFAALSMRADVAFGFGLIVAASSVEHTSFRKLALEALPRLAVCVMALTMFLVFQRSHALPGRAVVEFLRTYYDLRNSAAGVVTIVLATGCVTCLAAAYSVVGNRNVRDWLAVLVALIVPSLLFWLPNSTPARHMIFVTLGAALFVGLALRNFRTMRAVSAVVLVVVGNQVLAEAAYPILVARNDWEYTSITPRRAPYRMPLGMFFADHAARQEHVEQFRKEGIGLAAACSGRMVIFADQPSYFLLSMLDQGNVRFRRIEVLNTPVHEAVADRCTAHVVVKAPVWPRDAVTEFAQSEDYRGWRFYFQEMTRGKYDGRLAGADSLTEHH